MQTLADMWARHSAEWRDTAQVCSQWREASALDPRLLESKASSGWWATLERLGMTLLVTREYEHLVMAASVSTDARASVFSASASVRVWRSIAQQSRVHRQHAQSQPGVYAETRCLLRGAR